MRRWTTWALALFAVACGSAPRTAAPVTGPSGLSAAAPAPPPSAADGGPPPPMASSGPSRPLPAVARADAITPASSRRLSLKRGALPLSCPAGPGGGAGRSTSVEDAVRRCLAGGSARVLIPPTRVLLGARGAPHEASLVVEAGRCVRVIAAAAPASALSVVLRDGAGAIAAEGLGDGPVVAAPEGGALCARESERARLTLAVGSGEGAVAYAVISE